MDGICVWCGEGALRRVESGAMNWTKCESCGAMESCERPTLTAREWLARMQVQRNGEWREGEYRNERRYLESHCSVRVLQECGARAEGEGERADCIALRNEYAAWYELTALTF